jgi:uracil-DNA glycosylase
MTLIRPSLRVVVALGAFAWAAFWPAVQRIYDLRIKPRPVFGHGALWQDPNGDAPALLGCYHVSQQNTFTGRLTPGMLDEVLARAKSIAGAG